MSSPEGSGKKGKKTPEAMRKMRIKTLEKIIEDELSEKDKNRMKEIVSYAIAEYTNPAISKIKRKKPEKRTEAENEFLSSLRKDLMLSKGNKLSVQKLKRNMEKVNLNDKDILDIVASFLTMSDLKGEAITIKTDNKGNILPSYYNRIRDMVKQNATKVKESGKIGGTTFEQNLETGLGKWEFGSLGSLIGYLLTTKPEDIEPNRIGQLTDDQRGIILAKEMVKEYERMSEEEPKEEEPKGKEPKVEEPKVEEPKGKEPKEEESIDIEVEVPTEADPSGFKKAKSESEKESGGETTQKFIKRQAEIRNELVQARQRSIAFKKVLDDIANNKQSQEKVKSQNIHIQNEIQKKLPALANSITDQQRHNIATIIQMKALRAKSMGRVLELRNAINDATLRVTGKSVNQLKREEPISGQAKRFVGATQRKGSDVSKEEEEFAELSTNLIARMGNKQPEEMNKILLEVSADESDPMSDFARVYRENMDFLLQEDTPSGLSQSDLTATSSEEEESGKEASGEETETETESGTESGSESSSFMPITTKGKPIFERPPPIPESPESSGVSTKKVKVPEDWSENKQAKGTLRPKFISPSVNVLQPSEQDIQADFDEWAIFDFVQPVNNYGAEGNLENNPLKRMSRVEEETRYRNAGIDLDPSLASVFTDREVNTSQQAMAMDMLPPLMPDTSSQPRQVYDVSEYEVKSYDVNNDRTAIEYQSPYDNMTPIVLTNDEIRRSVLYGRVP